MKPMSTLWTAEEWAALDAQTRHRINLLAKELERQRDELAEALRLAAIRLEILTGRMRGCHEETGKHELLEEAEMFCAEARAALERAGR